MPIRAKTGWRNIPRRSSTPRRPIVDPHHHLWDRGGLRYMIEEMVSDIASGHNIIATVYVDCRSMYRAQRARGVPPGRRSRIRQRRRRDGRERRLRQGRDLRRHRQPRQSAARRRRQAGAGGRDRRRQWPLPRHPAFLGVGCRSRCRRHVCDAAEGPAARRDIPQGVRLSRAARPQLRRLAVSSADRRTHRSCPRLSGHQDRARSLRRPDRHRQLCQPARGDFSGLESLDPGNRQMPECRGQARRARDVPARL